MLNESLDTFSFHFHYKKLPILFIILLMLGLKPHGSEWDVLNLWGNFASSPLRKVTVFYLPIISKRRRKIITIFPCICCTDVNIIILILLLFVYFISFFLFPNTHTHTHENVKEKIGFYGEEFVNINLSSRHILQMSHGNESC